MQTRRFGSLGTVSSLTLGGGGIGQVWGETSREEGIATLRMAVDNGIDLIDAAPGYKICEALIGEAFEGRLPEGVRLTTKCGVGDVPPDEVYPRFRASLEESLKAMRVDRVELFFLHNPISAEDFDYPRGEDGVRWATSWTSFREGVIPAMQRLTDEGLIAAWGITAVGVPETNLAAIGEAPRPHAVQAVANLLDSPGGLTPLRIPPRPRDIIAAAQANSVAVMGIRAVQAGALTAAFDRDLPPGDRDREDFERAAPFRDLCARWSADPAIVAHRYALHMAGVDTLVLGVKNRAELAQALEAEDAGPLTDEEVAEIDGLGLRG